MKALKNIIAGFLVSFIGSIPLGYLNVIGYDVHQKSGIESVCVYLLGVIIIEAVVIYATLVFADRLMHNKKLIKYIELFSIFFMFLLAWSFYAAHKDSGASAAVFRLADDYSPFWTGVKYSSLNFIQIPFWTAWNLYLINARYISVQQSGRYVYLTGTLAGTFSGMLTLILCLDWLTKKNDFVSDYLMSGVIPLLFLGMGLLQAYKFWKKYLRKKPLRD
ncbi:hypothetical protein HYN48_06025 [Flavobacterium magnum]|uniref:Lysine transporter LysE n=1 Tax=Flavobacterium magnum TaxID=2162713 RepID=A0A2S0RD52_9FLAO|nr:hypothetical protein [Flavobacterium magnum]AWA29673.1 hypothetical protein HYN48_06025 [Flavobacterium magnum]